MGDVTQILSKIEFGDPSAAEQLLPLIYDELRALASAKMSDESPDHTLQATALVHEAYIRLVDVDQAQHWDSRGHFFAAAAEAMRRILVDSARRKSRARHGGGWERIDLAGDLLSVDESPDDLLSVDDALQQLEELDERAAQLLKLKFFAGLSTEESAALLGIPARTAYRNWAYARAWIFRHVGISDLPATE